MYQILKYTCNTSNKLCWIDATLKDRKTFFPEVCILHVHVERCSDNRRGNPDKIPDSSIHFAGFNILSMIMPNIIVSGIKPLPIARSLRKISFNCQILSFEKVAFRYPTSFTNLY